MTSDTENRLAQIRLKIDELDRELLALLNRRASLAEDVAAIKNSDQDCADYYRPDREARLLQALVESNRGPLPDHEVRRLFKEIVSACRALQKPSVVAFLGPAGTFTEAAVYKHFGRSVQSVPLGTIDAVFREVESGAGDYGLVPVENSTEGVVNHTLDMFMQSSLSICGEVELRIHHCLLGAGRSFDGVKRLYSHQQSFAQCRKWLDMHLPEVERIGVNSNAEAARRCAQEHDSVSVAGANAADTYGLNVLAANIEDEPNNTTRFLVVGARSVPQSGSDKTSLIFSAKNQPGALYALLEPFAVRRISMTRIESRPARSGIWEYVFFVDIEGHEHDSNVAEALAEISTNAAFVKVLGSYPRAVS